MASATDQLLAGVCVPHSNGLVDAPRDDPAAVRRVVHARHPSFVTAEDSSLGSPKRDSRGTQGSHPHEGGLRSYLCSAPRFKQSGKLGPWSLPWRSFRWPTARWRVVV